MKNIAGIDVICEFNISPRCRKQYQTSKNNAVIIKAHNNGKIICRFCSYALKYMGKNNPNSIYNIDVNFFEKIDTPEKAYLLGWIASDGHIGKFGFTIGIHGRDFECLERLKNIICTDIPITSRYDKKYKHNNVYMKINSQQISNDLCKHLKISQGKKSRTLHFPKLDNKILVREFIKGYFEGDGTLNNRLTSKVQIPVCGITSLSLKILQGLDGSFPDSYRDNCDGSGRWVHWSGKKAIAFLDWIYSDKSQKLDRKYLLYIDWKENFIPDKNIGELHYLAKLTEQKVKDIIKKNKNGVSQNKLSKEYGVSRRTIQDIFYGNTWKKITKL